MNTEKLKLLFEGKILESGERFYTYNSEKNEIQYSDDKVNWKTSNITINDFLKFNDWREAPL